MKFTLKIISVLTLAVSAMALPTTDTRVIQLRLWGETGCAENNMGELGLYQSGLDECGTFAGPYAIHSITTYYVVAGYAGKSISISLRSFMSPNNSSQRNSSPIQIARRASKM